MLVMGRLQEDYYIRMRALEEIETMLKKYGIKLPWEAVTELNAILYYMQQDSRK